MNSIITGKITGVSIGKYPGDKDTSRILQVEIGANDTVKVEQFTESGIDIAPAVGDKILVEFIGDSVHKVSRSTKDNFTPVSAAGEKEFYSHDDTVKKARIKLKLDGSLGIKNETTGKDFATEMTAFTTAIKNIVTTDSATVNPASQAALDVALNDLLLVVGGL